MCTWRNLGGTLSQIVGSSEYLIEVETHSQLGSCFESASHHGSYLVGGSRRVRVNYIGNELYVIFIEDNIPLLGFEFAFSFASRKGAAIPFILKTLHHLRGG